MAVRGRGGGDGSAGSGPEEGPEDGPGDVPEPGSGGGTRPRRAPRPQTLLARLRRTLARQVEELELRFSSSATVEEKDARTLATLVRVLEMLTTLEADAGRARGAAGEPDPGDGAGRAAGRFGDLPAARDGAAADAVRDALARRLEALCGDGEPQGGAR